MDASLLKDDPVLAEIVRRLVKAYEPGRVYLFGSKARVLAVSTPSGTPEGAALDTRPVSM